MNWYYKIFHHLFICTLGLLLIACHVDIDGELEVSNETLEVKSSRQVTNSNYSVGTRVETKNLDSGEYRLTFMKNIFTGSVLNLYIYQNDQKIINIALDSTEFENNVIKQSAKQIGQNFDITVIRSYLLRGHKTKYSSVECDCSRRGRHKSCEGRKTITRVYNEYERAYFIHFTQGQKAIARFSGVDAEDTILKGLVSESEGACLSKQRTDRLR